MTDQRLTPMVYSYTELLPLKVIKLDVSGSLVFSHSSSPAIHTTLPIRYEAIMLIRLEPIIMF